MNSLPRRALPAAVLVLLCACAHFPETGKLAAYNPATGYRYELLDARENRDDLFVILSFSGGGTRAAALAYGAIEALRDASVDIGGERRNLLKEVDVISSVSGGSFTAAYFGLYGEEIFAPGNRFHTDFLYRNIEADLIARVLNPYNWVRLASPTFGRIELAGELYESLLFGQATFRELEERRRKPFLVINATDMTKGAQFSFTQSQFDPMCADLGTVTIAHAVAASSNFPAAFTPLALNSYPGQCGYAEPRWVTEALAEIDANPSRYYRARMLRTYQEPDRRYVHLLDGGIADNIGMREPLTAIRSTDPAWSVLRKINLEVIRKLVVIMVDARNEVTPDYDLHPRAPGLVPVVAAMATTPLQNYSFDTIELLQDAFRRRANAQRQQPDLHRVELYRIYVGFDRIADDTERTRFLSMPTSFHLEPDAVDALRRKGRELLEQNPCYQQLIGRAPAGAPSPEQQGCP